MNEALDQQKYQEIRMLLRQIPTEELDQKGRNLANNQLSPNTRLNGSVYNTGDVSSVVADELAERYMRENPRFYLRRTNLAAEDMQKKDFGGSGDWMYSIAQMEQMNDAGISPEAEYREWVRAENRIRTDIYTNGTTQDEIDARNGFIDYLYDREIEISRVIELYQVTMFNGSKEYREKAALKLKFLLYKRSELLRLRESMKNTKDRADQPRETYFEKRVKEEIYDVVLGSQVERVLTTYRPVTKNKEEAQKKIDNLIKSNPRFVFKLLREGKSMDEIKKSYLEQMQNESGQNVTRQTYSPVYARRGFTKEAYRGYSA